MRRLTLLLLCYLVPALSVAEKVPSLEELFAQGKPISAYPAQVYHSQAQERQHPLSEGMESWPYAPDRVARGAFHESTQFASKASSLLGRVDERRKLRVIVEINLSYSFEPYLAHLSSAKARIASQRLRIATAQDTIIAALGISEADVTNRYESVPFLGLKIDAAELSRLLEHELVAGVKEDRLAEPALMESVPLIRAPEAVAAGYDGTGTVVAVLDSGVDKHHPFLQGKVVAEACFSTTDPEYNAKSLCPNGNNIQLGPDSGMNCDINICEHGTIVAGIIAGENSEFSGVAKSAGIISIQIYSEFDEAYCGEGNAPCAKNFDEDLDAGLAQIYNWRNQYPIVAANVSLGSGAYSGECDEERPSTKALIDLLRAANITTVVSVGNNGYLGHLTAPGCLSSAIRVSATSDSSQPEEECRYRADGVTAVDEVWCNANLSRSLDLLAPGSGIFAPAPQGEYVVEHGTSAAAPHVAGCWALIKQAHPDATVDEVKAALINSGIPVTDWRGSQITKPRIDCLGAIEWLNQDETQEIEITGNGIVINNGEEISLTTNHTAFGKVAVNTSVARTYTVRNNGFANLILGNQAVTLDGNCTAFVVTEQPASVVLAEEETSFTIQATPTDIGPIGCNVQVTSNDSDEPFYHFAISAEGSAQWVLCQQPGLAILDTLSNHLTINEQGTIADLNVSIAANHTWVGDLSLALRHVDTDTVITLVDQPGIPETDYGCEYDNMDVLLDDKAAESVANRCDATPPAVAGVLIPETPLRTLVGENISGEWRLEITDHYPGGDHGILDEWCLWPVLMRVLDIDGNGTVEANTDGVTLLKYLLGFRGQNLTGSIAGDACQRCDGPAIEDYLQANLDAMDIDGNGKTDALTDGILVMRYLTGYMGDALVAGVISTEDCDRCTVATIQAYLAQID